MSTSTIPVRNLYYLLCYAWNSLPEAAIVEVAKLQSPKIVDLLAHVLIGGFHHLMRRGLERNYNELVDELAGIRGRVDIVGSARRLLLAHGKASCTFDELTLDTPANRILKSTLLLLSGAPDLDPTLRAQSQLLRQHLAAVHAVPLSSRLFRTVQLSGNNRYYRFLLHVCELILNACLVDEATGQYRFRDFTRDDRAMARVFEDFVFNFYRLERRDLIVKEERIAWQAVSETDPTLALLPQMRTDVSITFPNTKLIVDTKYYSKTLSEYYDAESVRSGHLYQMFAYLMNTPKDSSRVLQGMLLYPEVQQRLRLSYLMQGMRIQVCTVDLAQEWQGIREELLGLIEDL